MPEPCSSCGRGEDDRGLIGACDVMVMRALELIGKRIVRIDRSRYARLEGRPFHQAYLLWQPDAEQLEKSLAGAWDYLPQIIDDHADSHVTGSQLALLLDRYVRDLIQARRGHDVDELRFRMKAFT